MSLELSDVTEAARRIDGRVRRTPVMTADGFGTPVWFKYEFMQYTGSFKARGAVNRILALRDRGELTDAGIVAASGGNAGVAYAWAARELGVAATVFVPRTASPVKVARLHRLGATVHQVGTEYADAQAAALDHLAATGAALCHPYDQPEVCAGQGTVALELREQLPSVDTVLVSTGGGGLVAGVAAGYDHRARVVAVEPEAAPTMHAALAAGEPVDVAVGGVCADALGARRVGRLALATATSHRIRSVLVDDDAVLAARQRLWDEYRVVVEPSAAASLAALTSGAYRPEPGENVVVLLCGANTDPSDLV